MNYIVSFLLIILAINSIPNCKSIKISSKKQDKSTVFKNSTEACLFIDCSCQNILDTKLAINCTGAIGIRGGVSLYFPKRIDTENFMDFDKQIDSFLFIQNNFKTINDDTFKNLRIGCLELRENRLETLKTNTFRGIKQINRLLLINEKKLKTIEKDTFLPVKYLLLELDMSFNDIEDAEYDKFSTEITKLSTLQQLNLNNNRLTIIKSKWFVNLTSLDILNLGYNYLKKIEPDGFSELQNLQRIFLNNNRFNGYFDQSSFESLRPSLVRINLSNNKIRGLPVFGYLEKLRYLDLSNNSIELIETNTFTLLANLYSLDLNDNFISKMEKNALATLTNLYYLKLKNNYLAKLPDISKLASLVVLDVMNQNGHLISLNDFQFERIQMPNLALELNVAQNDIFNFKNKAFCSHNYQDSQIDKISLSFKTFSSLIDSNHCIISQLKPVQYLAGNYSNRQSWTHVNIIDISKDQDTSQINYCNCDLFLMFQNLKLNVTGLRNCDLFSYDLSANSCSNSSFIDTCFTQDDYKCSPLTTTTKFTRSMSQFNSSKQTNRYFNRNSASTSTEINMFLNHFLFWFIFGLKLHRL